MARPSSGKRNVEQAKRERAARKRERRDRTDEPNEVSPTVADGRSEQELLDALQRLQARFEAEEIAFDEYEAEKAELLTLLSGG